MADETTKVDETAKADKAPKVKYFKTRLDGLKILIEDNNAEGGNDPSLLEYFTGKRYSELFRGERVRTQIFTVDKDTPKRVVELLESDGNVVEITAKQFDDFISDPETKPLFAE